MTLAELSAYLGFMGLDEIEGHIGNCDLPRPINKRPLRDPTARWDQNQVDAALTLATAKRRTSRIVPTLTMTPEQIRTARQLLNWSYDRLAGEAGVALQTLLSAEAGRSKSRARTLASIRTALEAAGVEFTDGNRPGVRLKEVTP